MPQANRRIGRRRSFGTWSGSRLGRHCPCSYRQAPARPPHRRQHSGKINTRLPFHKNFGDQAQGKDRQTTTQAVAQLKENIARNREAIPEHVEVSASLVPWATDTSIASTTTPANHIGHYDLVLAADWYDRSPHPTCELKRACFPFFFLFFPFLFLPVGLQQSLTSATAKRSTFFETYHHHLAATVAKSVQPCQGLALLVSPSRGGSLERFADCLTKRYPHLTVTMHSIPDGVQSSRSTRDGDWAAPLLLKVHPETSRFQSRKRRMHWEVVFAACIAAVVGSVWYIRVTCRCRTC